LGGGSIIGGVRILGGRKGEVCRVWRCRLLFGGRVNRKVKSEKQIGGGWRRDNDFTLVLGKGQGLFWLREATGGFSDGGGGYKKVGGGDKKRGRRGGKGGERV